MAPAASYDWAWVLPTSKMSGLSAVGSTLSSRLTSPSHSWRSTSTVTFGYCSANSALASSIISSGVSGPLSQTRNVASVSSAGAASAPSSSDPPVLASSSSDPQAARASRPASVIAASFLVFTSSSQTSGGEPPDPSRLSCDAQLSVENEHRGTEEDVVLPERAEAEVDVVADRRHRAGADGVERRGTEGLVEHVERARQHHLAQVERADDGGQRLAQPVAGGGALGHRAALAGATPQPGGADGGLEAAGAPAGAHLALRA